jgi:hypothetical protein
LRQFRWQTRSRIIAGLTDIDLAHYATSACWRPKKTVSRKVIDASHRFDARSAKTGMTGV